jgi:hypothetical protein
MSDAPKQLDLETLVRKVLEAIQSDIDFVYPHREYVEDRAHPGLLSIQGRVRSLIAVLDCIKETPKEVSDGSNPG